jgi:2-oxoglutarate dehydrogenase E2 component (dihydrolipoamide succinyltransferase)
VPADVLIPELGESITDGVIVRWLKDNGAVVRADEPLLELETDKATVEIPATADGRLQIVEQAGATVRVGAVVARIVEDTAAPAPSARPAPRPTPRQRASAGTAPAPAAVRRPPPPVERDAAREPADLDPSQIRGTGKDGRPTREDVLRHVAQVAAGRVEAPPDEQEAPRDEQEAPRDEQPGRDEQEAPRDEQPGRDEQEAHRDRQPTPAAKRVAPGDARPADEPKVPPIAVPRRGPAPGDETDAVEREPMSRLRRRIAERLVEAQRTAAILTTFNEVDLSRLLAARKRHRERFRERHGVDLGLMSLFGRACLLALADVPILNARIDGDDIVYHRRVHLGIAVSTPHGLVVPVVRDADRLSLAGLERAIEELAREARAAKLTPNQLAGGTFTITNGGVFGSLLSTPILNPPQSGILGMHKIEDRPVAVEGQVLIRPMMYVALSYDHRLVDGEQAVTFLVRVKERLEDPVRMLFEV